LVLLENYRTGTLKLFVAEFSWQSCRYEQRQGDLLQCHNQFGLQIEDYILYEFLSIRVQIVAVVRAYRNLAEDDA
jgi:hypothetical protein